MNQTNTVFEILKWKSKSEVSDEQMISAVNVMVADLTTLQGFLNQTLYKDSNGFWVDVYYWETEQNAHDSNGAMADKASFKDLMGLTRA
ncbi:MAG: hypothetical protein COB30_011535 [Ectothiorhodospiraceae bacterium]|nr:hypothetical protein [Ectothiorhodospiraceae bacterium]